MRAARRAPAHRADVIPAQLAGLPAAANIGSSAGSDGPVSDRRGRMRDAYAEPAPDLPSRQPQA